MAYGEWFEIYKQQDVTQSTIERVEYYFNKYLLDPELFGGLYFERMTVLDIQRRVNKFIPKYVTSKAILSYAKQIFKYAMASEHIVCEKNYLDLVRMVKPKKATKRAVRYYTETQSRLFEQGL
ncbi:site-specific integrase, partial [Weissella ceti]|nr:site-specific integrase [Weissella ceti]